MVNYYTVLGVTASATDEEIRVAYRRKAAVNHPDKGGTATRFQQIHEAYNALKTAALRAEYNKKLNANYDDSPWWDNFNAFNFKQKAYQPPAKNADVNVSVSITLLQSFTGATIVLKYQIPNECDRNAIVEIPAGILNGQTMTIKGGGSTKLIHAVAGDLKIKVCVEQDSVFSRVGDDLHSNFRVPLVNGLFGGNLSITSIDNTIYEFPIIPGTCTDTIIFPCAGFRNLATGKPGNLVISTSLEVPDLSLLSDNDKATLSDLISSLPKSK